MLDIYLHEPRTLSVAGFGVDGGALINNASLAWKIQTKARVDVANASGTLTAAGTGGNYSGTVGPLTAATDLELNRKYLLVVYEDVTAANRRLYREIEVHLIERATA